MSSNIKVIALQMMNINESIIIDYFSFKTLCWISDVSLISACNTELCNNLEAVYFCRGRNIILFS
jgi:hypothetical protein